MELNAIRYPQGPDNFDIEKFKKFGGVPRLIFSDIDDEEEALDEEIRNFQASKIISYIKDKTVREEKYSHKVLCMVPDENFRTIRYLDFISEYAAEHVINNIYADSRQELSEFFAANIREASAMPSTLLGRIYEMLCHKILKNGGIDLHFTGRDGISVTLKLPKDVTHQSFTKFDDITLDTQALVYYVPTFSTFGALDSFIIDRKTMRCFGLQITINRDHGIKRKPLCDFLQWLEDQGIPNFYFGFMVPKHLASNYPKQVIRTSANMATIKPGKIDDLKQYVVPLDIF